MVDSSPTWHSPPSRITCTASPNSSRTCSARVGLDVPVAIGRRRGDAAAEGVSSCCAIGCAGTRMATLSWPPVTMSCTLAARGSTSVSGPGQKRCGQLLGHRRHLAHPARAGSARCRGARSPDAIGGRPLSSKTLPRGRRIWRVRAEPIDGLGRKRDQLAVAQRLARRLPVRPVLPGPRHTRNSIRRGSRGQFAQARAVRTGPRAYSSARRSQPAPCAELVGGPVVSIELERDHFRRLFQVKVFRRTEERSGRPATTLRNASRSGVGSPSTSTMRRPGDRP